jgi:hypothetical protein
MVRGGRYYFHVLWWEKGPSRDEYWTRFVKRLRLADWWGGGNRGHGSINPWSGLRVDVPVNLVDGKPKSTDGQGPLAMKEGKGEKDGENDETIDNRQWEEFSL